MPAPNEPGAPQGTDAIRPGPPPGGPSSRGVASEHDLTWAGPASAVPESHGDAATPARLGAYRIAGRLGAGGMSEVLAVVDPSLSRTVAAKVMRGQATEVERRRFLAEARITGELEHPNIVPVHALMAEPTGPVFFTMKRVQGEDLVARIKRIRSLEERGDGRPGDAMREWLITYLKVLDAVGFAHANGVVHRDLKPANVMCGEHGEVYVCDWGLAKRYADAEGDAPHAMTPSDADPFATCDGTIVGTPSYMSPEQARGETASPDPRSDIYGLGAILYELLTFEPPYRGATALETIELVDAGPPTPPRERSPHRNIPRELEAVVQKAMARELTRRYADVASLRADVLAYLDGGFIGAARYSPAEWLLKFARRHRIAAAAALAAVITAGAFALPRAWGRHAEARRQLARIAAARHQLQALSPDAALETARALVRDAPPALAAKEVTATFAQRGAHLASLRALRAVAGAAAQVLSLEPAAPVERALAEDALVAIFSLACLGGDHALAEFALGQAHALGGNPERIARATAALDADRLALRARQRARVDAQLAAARAGELRSELELARATVELAGINEPETLAAMAQALDELGPPLRRAIVDSLAGVAIPTEEEASAGERPIQNLDAIVSTWIDTWRWAGEPPGPSLGSEHQAELERALGRYEGRAWRAMQTGGAKGGRSRWPEILGRIQSTAIPGGAASRTVELASAVLGELHGSPVAVRALARHLLIEYDQPRAVAAGRALARLAERDPVAERALLAFVGAVEVPHALAKWQLSGTWWAQVRGAYRPSSPPAVPGIESGAATGLSALLDRGNGAMARRDYASAERTFSEAIALAPADARSHEGRAVAFLHLGDSERALVDADTALELSPESAGMHYIRASALRRLGRTDDARAAFAAALRLDPENPATLVERAKLLRDTGDRAGALSDLDRAIGADPRRTQAYAERGRLHLEAGHFALALADYDQALGLAPDDSDALLGRSNTRVEAGNLDGALADLDHALDLDPSNSRAHANRGRIRILRGELDPARADLNRALELDPRYVKALINRSTVSRMQRDFARAREDLDRALAIAPGSAELYAYRGGLGAEEGRLDEAAADLDRALELDPDATAVLLERGKLYAKRGDPVLAARDFSRAAELAPRDPNPFRNLAVLAMGAGDLARARQHLDKAIEAAPRSAELLAIRGGVITRLGDPAAALADFERALALDARLWQVECLAGEALVALGRKDEAARAFERARDRAPTAQVAAVERMREQALGR